ncbi:MAG: ABC transporter ATP-binding protein [Planctomycetota bacterium]
MSGPPAIEVLELRKSYEGGAEAVQGVSFSIPRGQICGYLGPNGAGKSTTIKILAGILEPSSGTVRIAGHDLTQDPLAVKRVLGYVPESGALYGLLSGREHLSLVADLHELEPARAASKIQQLLELFGLEAVCDRRIDSLSKGQKQRVAIAGALLHDPEVVLLDEPLNGLDANAVRSFKDLIAGLAAKGRTVLYCSHVLDVVERICERAIIIAGGKIVADAPTSELVQRSQEKTLEGVFHALTRAADDEVLAQAFLRDVQDAPR